jgi:hypothetical protein
MKADVALALTGLVLLVLALLNAWATRAVLLDGLSSRNQRAAQITFVWLVPLIGALLTLYLKRGQSEAPSGKYREDRELGDDYGYLRPHLHLRRTDTTRLSESAGSGETATSD